MDYTLRHTGIPTLRFVLSLLRWQNQNRLFTTGKRRYVVQSWTGLVVHSLFHFVSAVPLLNHYGAFTVYLIGLKVVDTEPKVVLKNME